VTALRGFRRKTAAPSAGSTSRGRASLKARGVKAIEVLRAEFEAQLRRRLLDQNAEGAAPSS